MKQITKEEMQALINNKVVRNSHSGIIGKNGFPVGFYRTRNKRYIEDKYANIAKRMR